MRDLILHTAFKIAENRITQAVMLRTLTNLLSNIDKTYYFKQAEHHDKQITEAFYKAYHVNNAFFFSNIINQVNKMIYKENVTLNYYLQTLRRHVRMCRQMHKRLKAFKRTKSLYLEKYPWSISLNKFSNGNIRRQALLDEWVIVLRHHHLSKSLEQRQWTINASRKYHTNKMSEYIMLNQHKRLPFLDGMSLDNQMKFIKAYFRIKEKETIETVQIEFNIHAGLTKRLEKEITKEDAMLNQYSLSKSKPAPHQKRTLQKMKQLGTQTGNRHINSTLSDDDCFEKCYEFENTTVISQPLQAHLAVVKEQATLIESEKQELAQLDRELTLLQSHIRLAHLHQDSEADLDSLGIDPHIDLSQLNVISLVDNLGKRRSKP